MGPTKLKDRREGAGVHCNESLGLGGIPVLVTIFGIMSKPVARYHQNFDTGISIIQYYRKNTVLQSKIDGHCTIILINAHLTKLLPTLYMSFNGLALNGVNRGEPWLS